jgi:hypothetical protein
MPLADTLSGTEWALLGISIVLGVMVARWLPRRGPVDQEQDEEESAVEKEVAHSAPAARVAQLEVRLHDFAREVEARLETRAAQLDRLVAAADHEIIRLQELLSDVPRAGDPRRPDIVVGASKSSNQIGDSADGRQPPNAEISPAEAEMAGHLRDAGFSVSEIAHMVGRPAEVVESALRAA